MVQMRTLRPLSIDNSLTAVAPAYSRCLEADAVSGDEARIYASICEKRRWWTDRPFALEALTLAAAPVQALDVGCGPGHIAVLMAGQAPGLTVTALDISRDMLDVVGENARKAGVGDRVIPALGDMTSLPYEAGSFDLVVSQYALHHLPHPEQAVAEMCRVLRSGGALFVKDMLRPVTRRRARLLVDLVGLVIGYGPSEKRQYLESLDACLSWDEARALAGGGLACERRAFSQFVLRRTAS